MRLQYTVAGKSISQRVDSLHTASALAAIVEDRHGATECFPYHDDGKPVCDFATWLLHLESARSMLSHI